MNQGSRIQGAGDLARPPPTLRAEARAFLQVVSCCKLTRIGSVGWLCAVKEVARLVSALHHPEFRDLKGIKCT